jgi:hypothetical protein
MLREDDAMVTWEYSIVALPHFEEPTATKARTVVQQSRCSIAKASPAGRRSGWRRYQMRRSQYC